MIVKLLTTAAVGSVVHGMPVVSVSHGVHTVPESNVAGLLATAHSSCVGDAWPDC